MRLDTGGSDDYVEDRRGARSGGPRLPGFGGGGPRLGGGVGLGVIVLVGLFTWLSGGDLSSVLGLLSGDGASGVEDSSEVAPGGPINDEAGRAARDMLNDIQGTWTGILRQYQPTTLVLFTDATDSGCGFAQSATGPFYCPGDRKVYIDLAFYDELHRRFGAPGDFAQAYVLAHEIGHHVQNLLGTEREMRRAQQANPDRANELSVRMELQADCYAGIWGNSVEGRGKLDPGDVEEGLAAAAAIGDDRLQRQSTGRVAPESFTHGTSAQRVQWLRRGLEQGSVEACDTFSAR